MIQNSGATSLLPAALKTTVLVAYNESLRQLFRVGLILACVTMLGALAMEWRSVKKGVAKQEKKGEEDGATLVEGESKEARDSSVNEKRS